MVKNTILILIAQPFNNNLWLCSILCNWKSTLTSILSTCIPSISNVLAQQLGTTSHFILKDFKMSQHFENVNIFFSLIFFDWTLLTSCHTSPLLCVRAFGSSIIWQTALIKQQTRFHLRWGALLLSFNGCILSLSESKRLCNASRVA